mmetsp:Transcript_19062/g.31234  ORF Transcript_19062/g.31234 Transcript_19062/m.31234 type:complete len:376 (-) Transcript_19062:78-1205(-)|eukprot:CAMPEP_0184657034 /NCGR_PEP_ID=MMETSP0308-20130426/16922_1 /TAXON_ID=38269 /ORGANISM="Gloeochaete witrockiana, Strain SAG 46.84" /LENGTH=375 /DNA_ID=CAMNT_0027094403 /DNA_START=96 /DNA_END=1223 /DNA_ORIENTATION=+
MAFRGLVISSTGLTALERERVEHLVKSMSGEFHRDFTGAVTHLVATKVGSEKYKVALKLSKPIVTIEWVENCNTAGMLLPTLPYLLPPFASCVISITGFTPDMRTQIQALTKEYGGEFSAGLSKRCTHLIANSPTGEKYLHAINWGTPVVTLQWFSDSIRMKGCADPCNYPVPPAFPTSPFSAAGALAALRSSSNSSHPFHASISALPSSDVASTDVHSSSLSIPFDSKDPSHVFFADGKASGLEHSLVEEAGASSLEQLMEVLQRAKELCDAVISSHVTGETAGALLQVADKSNATNLRTVCLELLNATTSSSNSVVLPQQPQQSQPSEPLNSVPPPPLTLDVPSKESTDSTTTPPLSDSEERSPKRSRHFPSE